jgi:hypothetical protein
MSNRPTVPIGTRVRIDDELYEGEAIVLEDDPDIEFEFGIIRGPYYCHLVGLCDHEWCDDDELEDEGLDGYGAECRGWYDLASADVLEPAGK